MYENTMCPVEMSMVVADGSFLPRGGARCARPLRVLSSTDLVYSLSGQRGILSVLALGAIGDTALARSGTSAPVADQLLVLLDRLLFLWLTVLLHLGDLLPPPPEHEEKSKSGPDGGGDKRPKEDDEEKLGAVGQTPR